jgi:hypothetical protein
MLLKEEHAAEDAPFRLVDAHRLDKHISRCDLLIFMASCSSRLAHLQGLILASTSTSRIDEVEALKMSKSYIALTAP